MVYKKNFELKWKSMRKVDRSPRYPSTSLHPDTKSHTVCHPYSQISESELPPTSYIVRVQWRTKPQNHNFNKISLAPVPRGQFEHSLRYTDTPHSA